MYAIEFESAIHDGIVQLPEKFKQLYSSPNAKIIIMVEEEQLTQQKTDFIEMLANNPKHLNPNTTFLSRDQANER